MKKMMILGLLLFWATDLSADSYLIIELPPPSLDSTTSTGALGISADGSYVAGYAGEGRARHGVRWTLSKPPVHLAQIDDIGVLSPATTSIAYGVNSSGTVVGTSGSQAVLWSAPSPGIVPIPPPQGAPTAGRCVVAYAINDPGLVVGFYSEAEGSETAERPWWAFSWTPNGGTTRHDGNYRSTLGSVAYAVNYGGVIAGEAEVGPYGTVLAATQAHLWSPTTGTVVLGALFDPDGPGESVAYDINDSREAVGSSEGQAVVWSANGGLATLGVSGTAADINNDGVIVGNVSNSYPFVKKKNQPIQNLNGLIPTNSGWTLFQATGISENGWIVGIGIRGLFIAPGDDLGASSLAGTKDLTVGEEGPANAIRGFVLIPQ